MSKFAESTTLRVIPMSKHPEKQDKPSDGKQVNFRAPPALMARLEFVSEWLNVDISGIVRMVLSESLAPYEQRARQVQASKEATPDNGEES